MKALLIIVLIFGGMCYAFSQDLEVIKADTNIYESCIESYKTNEMWGIWTMPIGKPYSSSHLSPQISIDYEVGNISDYDLNTAWIIICPKIRTTG
jgi:hypothetical protein